MGGKTPSRRKRQPSRCLVAASGVRTVRQRRFVEEFVGCWNAAEAARRAGYSAQSAKQHGHNLLKVPAIIEAIKAHADTLSMSAEEAKRRMTDWGRGSLAPFLSIDDRGVRIDLTTPAAQANLHLVKKLKTRDRILEEAIIEIPAEDGTPLEVKQTVLQRTIELELHDAKDAVSQMAKIRGLLVERTKTDITIAIFQLIAQLPTSDVDRLLDLPDDELRREIARLGGDGA